MYIYIYTHIHTHTHTHTHTHAYVDKPWPMISHSMPQQHRELPHIHTYAQARIHTRRASHQLQHQWHRHVRGHVVLACPMHVLLQLWRHFVSRERALGLAPKPLIDVFVMYVLICVCVYVLCVLYMHVCMSCIYAYIYINIYT